MSLVLKLLGDDVKKPSALVHFEREMSPVEQKIMTLIIFHSQVMESDGKGFYYIKKSFVREFLGWEDSHNYRRIYQAFEGIFDNSIKWNFLGTDRTFKSLRCKLIVSLLEPTETGPTIGYKLHPDLEPVIKDPKVFARIKLIMMSILAKPKYAFPLYEILSDFYSRGERRLEMPLEALRQSLGIKDDAYEEFVPFKRRVLKPNIDAINKNTDCRVRYSTYRKGRKVGGLVFQIEKQSWQPPLLMNHFKELKSYYESGRTAIPLAPEDEDPAVQAFLDSVTPYQVTPSDAREAVEVHGLDGAAEIRDYVLSEVERRKHGQDPVRDVGAYLVRCFQGGFGKHSAEERAAAEQRQRAASAKRAQEAARTRAQAAAEQLRGEFWRYQVERVDEQLAALTPEVRKDFDERFLQKHSDWAKRYREQGLDSPMVRAAFYRFAVEVLLSADERDMLTFAKRRGAPAAVLKALAAHGVAARG